MPRLLLDTNAIIQHLKKSTLDLLPKETVYHVSVISEAEVLRLGGIGKEEQEGIEAFLQVCIIEPITSPIARIAASIGRTRRTKLQTSLLLRRHSIINFHS